MTVRNRYQGFSLFYEEAKRNRDSDFGSLRTRNLESINTANEANITNRYNNYGNRFGSSNHYNPNELQLVQSMVTETINHNGMTVRYMPRKSDYPDDVWNERPESVFDKGVQIDMLLASTAGFEGEGDLMTQYGIEFREEVVMKCSIPRFESLYGEYMRDNPDYYRVRPLEGDLIVIPFGISSLNGNQYVPKFFEITRVTTYHDGTFFQMGDNYQYKIKARLFELSYEKMGWQPKVQKVDVYDEEIEIVKTKPQQLEENPVVVDDNGYVNITKDSEQIPDTFADNHVLEKESQVRTVYDYEGNALEDKPKVTTKDYTAVAFGYAQGVINNLDDI